MSAHSREKHKPKPSAKISPYTVFLFFTIYIGVNPPTVASSSQEQVDYESKNESFIGEWSDEEEEEEESAPPPQRRVVSQSSRTRKQYSETIHVSVREND